MTRYRVDPAASFLVKAFAPGPAGALRDWSLQRVSGGQRLAIAFDLADPAARQRAADLVASAPSWQWIAVGRTVIRDLAAHIAGDQLTVAALLVREPAAGRS
jgi:hypothetical protein